MDRFHRIIIDGSTYEGAGVRRKATELHTASGGASWSVILETLLTDLSLHKGPLAVRTSGTTGPPKALSIPRRDLIASARLTAEAFKLHEGDRALLCLPCEYIAGKMMVVRAFVIGLDVHIVDPRGAVLENLRTEDRFRFTAMVPLQLYRAIQEDKARVERQFDTVLLGGGPVSDALIEDLQGLRTRVFLGYGSTETITHVALRQLNGPERSTMFTALGDITFARDERGCLIVHTPHLTVKEHVTNDMVDLLDNRHFRWQGRHDNVILSGGKKIYPEQLEAKTAGLVPYPHFFAAFPEDKLGEGVMLVLEMSDPDETVVQEVLDILKNVLDEHELPRRVMARRLFERTPNGKVIRAV